VTERPKPAVRRSRKRPVRKSDQGGFEERDPLGKMALFSEIEPQEPATGWLWIECSSCLKETSVSPLNLVKATLPFSFHLPFRRPYHSFMRCPACGKRTWVRVTLRPS
jgi:uncharacterized protein with PIN domain